MTKISFHHDLPDPQTYLHRLLRQIYRKATPVAVVGDMPALQTLSAQLWQLNEQEFIPHALPRDPDRVQAHSLLQLCTTLSQAHQQALAINLCTHVPPDFARFDKIIELVGTAESARLAARERLKFYKSRGYAIEYFAFKG